MFLCYIQVMKTVGVMCFSFNVHEYYVEDFATLDFSSSFIM